MILFYARLKLNFQGCRRYRSVIISSTIYDRGDRSIHQKGYFDVMNRIDIPLNSILCNKLILNGVLYTFIYILLLMHFYNTNMLIV